MKYAEAVHRLFNLQARGMRLGLEHTRLALRRRGSPERSLRFIQVAGTNGKGSVAAMAEAALRAAGFRTGLFTSPHLHRFVERIRIAGRPLSEVETAARITETLAALTARQLPELSFFEIATVLAIEAFRDHDCELVVLEAGLGGRLDSTTAVDSEVAVITRIALDHTEILGSTTAAIAAEKAAIIKRGGAAVIGACDPQAQRVIAARIAKVRARSLWLGRDFAVEPADACGRMAVTVGETRVNGIRPRLAGAHQLDNIACATAALICLRQRGWEISDTAVRRGIHNVKWPGRLELIPGRPAFLFDAAHNPDGCAALARYLAERALPAGKTVLLFGAMADKDYPAMLRILAPLFDRVIFGEAPLPRAASCAALRRAWPAGEASRHCDDALARATHAAGASGLVTVAGSIFLMATVRARRLGLRSDPLLRM